MKDVIDAVSSRIKTPYFGYAILAFFALNWRGIFLLAATTGSPQERLAAFDSATNHYTLLVLPLLAGAVVAASTSWVQYIFGVVSRKPAGLIDNLYLEAEHKKTIRQAELEQSRSNLFAVKEKELIDRAKRDEEVAGIEDDAAKEKLAAQIESLRWERDQLSAQLKDQSAVGKPSAYKLSKEAIEIIKAASQSKSGTIIKPKSIGERTIQAGEKSFGSENSRDFAKYDAALDELIKQSLIKGLGAKGEVFELTNNGWQVADAL
ncbi:hypothetical protein [Stutzerimonas stutzeri]|uniref:hypothetical protein n=1 Tax=Stutzerimonas stutzeri TaxID=316 RepID=UPI0015E28A9F|nr:hypothetical protein [Stutzerimonas stutzeri]MBA1276834.1 hypothetical protein [Stutzerimonas stutzeri]